MKIPRNFSVEPAAEDFEKFPIKNKSNLWNSEKKTFARAHGEFKIFYLFLFLGILGIVESTLSSLRWSY